MTRCGEKKVIAWGVLALVSVVALSGCGSDSTPSEATAPAQTAQKQGGAPDPAAIQAGQSRSVSAIQNNPNLSDEQKKRMADAIAGKVR